MGSRKRTAEAPERSSSRVSKRSKTENTSGSEHAAISPSLPAKSSGLDLSHLDLTSLPIRNIPDAFATFAGNKLGFTQYEHHFIPKEELEPEYDSSLKLCPEAMLKYRYLKRATHLYHNAQENGKFAREAFLAEAKVYETLLKNPHPNIAKYWGCHVVNGSIRGLVLSKYAMTLEERVRTGVPLDTELCLKEIKDGIEHLHSLGLTHNDIHQRNIIMDAADRPVIIDFDTCVS
ncbi:hypothetical protein ACKAV7_012160 [Fusarium commune]